MPREPFGMTDATALGEQVRATAGPAEPRIGTDEHQAVNWLTRLHLLRGVPFGYLVPDIAMLPSESIRFFQVDAGWIDALIDGAFSIGATRGTAASGAALRTATAPVVRARLHRVRAAIVGPAETSTAESGPAGTSSVPEAISGFLLLYAVAGLRRWRRSTLRFHDENARIEEWLKRIEALAADNYWLAVELARSQRLIKGYGETHERGWASFCSLLQQLPRLAAREDGATVLARLTEAALADEEGAALRREIAALDDSAPGEKSLQRALA